MTQRNFNPVFIAAAVRDGDPAAGIENFSAIVEPFQKITTDSRGVGPGDFFVALKGDAFDGNEFVAEAIEKGATGILCQRGKAPRPVAKGVAYFEVDDTLKVFRKIAAAWRLQFEIPVICVAGSVGKTTTKEMIAAILRGKYAQVLQTESSQNGFIGIPITLLKLSQAHEAAVVEIGIDDKNAMAQHLELVRPTASVVTVIGEEHLEQLGDLKTVAEEESLALSYVGARGGVVALNVDDPWLAPWSRKNSWTRMLAFSMKGEESASVKGFHEPGTSEISITGLSLRDAKFQLPLPGSHNAQNLLAAVTLALGLGLTEPEIRKGLASFSPPKGRSQVLDVKGMTVLADYYNANPNSMRAALEMFGTYSGKTKAKKWVCLGDMLELGPEELHYHRDLISPIVEQKMDGLFLFGPRMKTLFEILSTKDRPFAFHHFDEMDDLLSAFLPRVKKGDLILIKGSRGMKMERVLEALR